MRYDLELLPAELRSLSLSDREIVLPYAAALQAIEALRTNGVGAVGWEGWIRTPEGRVGHAAAHQGTISIEQEPGESWSAYVQRSLDMCAQTISADYAEWIGAGAAQHDLYFCITCHRQDD